MLNSNYFSKKHFTLNLRVFKLWLETKYGISFIDTDNLDKQISYYHSYIRFLNYREKYIQQQKSNAKKNIEKKSEIMQIIERELLSNLSIISYSDYIK